MSADFGEIKDGLKAAIETLAKELAPDGRKNGNYWIARNPARADRRPGSFWILLCGNATGAWRDEAAGVGGDVVQLVGYIQGHRDLKETRAWCLKWLGLASGSAPALTEAERAARDQARQAAIAAREKEDAAARAETSRKAFGLWLKAEKLTPASFRGSLVDLYFRSRALDLAGQLLDRGRPLPGALRFFPKHDYLLADGEILEFPCLAALMSGPDGRGQALHRTWLQPDGSGKAALPDPRDNKARKIWGPPAGAVIRIAKGDGDLTPEEAGRQGKRGPLVITEGVEDALAVSLALPRMRVWAAGTLGNIGNAPVLDCVSRITICADNDSHPDARAAFERGLAKLKSNADPLGVPVKVARSPRGKDMNDLLKGETT